MNPKLIHPIYWLISVLFLISHSVHSQQVELLHDINTTSTQDAEPEYISMTNNLIFFAANDGIHGLELWKSDGTAAGTQIVKDIIPGFGVFEITGGVALDEIAIYSVDTEEYGVELWRTDGTEAGTFLIKDINPGKGDGMFTWPTFYRLGNEIYFNGNDGVHGGELWKTDGTSAGTVMVKDINPGSLGSSPTVPSFKLIGNTIYFNADDGVHGDELWKTQGTASTTELVKDINPGQANSNPGSFFAFNGLVFFQGANRRSWRGMLGYRWNYRGDFAIYGYLAGYNK